MGVVVVAVRFSSLYIVHTKEREGEREREKKKKKKKKKKKEVRIQKREGLGAESADWSYRLVQSCATAFLAKTGFRRPLVNWSDQCCSAVPTDISFSAHKHTHLKQTLKNSYWQCESVEHFLFCVCVFHCVYVGVCVCVCI